ncbi:MAG: CpsD/CapB family tyrosine-protein kinase [bacterium]
MSKRRYYYEETPEATAFKRIYNKIHLQHDRHHTNVFLLTSANVGEGKSTAAAFLATASARYRRMETLLIDCDLRRPMIHKLYNLPNEQGVADILAEDVNIKSVLKPSAIPNLKIITAGIPKQSPADLFSTVHLQEMFKKIRFYFKIVLIDAPPIIPVSDTLLLSNETDAIVFVFKAGHTPKRVAKRALELLEDNRKKLLGVVINNEKGALPYYYDPRYYGYEYYGY